MKILSPYIYYSKLKGNDLIVLDSYNGNIFKVSAKLSDKFFNYISKPNNLKDDNSLIKNKIVVEENYYTNHVNLYNEFMNKKDYLHLVILPTEDCNFRCTYCYEKHNLLTMDSDTILSIIKYVENQLPDYGALRIEWFGGEPLYAKEVIYNISDKLINICKKYKKPYYASMTTNGYELDIDTFKTLFKYKVVKYQITLDGLKDHHDKQRFLKGGSGTFDVILKNLKNIRDTVKTNFFNITIRCNLTSENRKSFGEYLDFIKKEFGNDLRFNFLWKIAWNPEANECDTYLAQNALRSVLQESALRKLNLETSKNQMSKFGNICYASNKNSFIIGPNGNLYKCTVAFDKEINHIGKLHKNGIMEINDEKFQFWTERKSDCIQKKCLSCFLYPSCLGIYCNLNNHNEKGEFLCSGFKNYIDEYLNCIVQCNNKILDLEL